MMDADDLALLDVIISEGGITAAARKLGQPKTTVSRRLRGLETAAGVQLFERSGRKLRLTRVGEAFAAPARDIRRRLSGSNKRWSASTLPMTPGMCGYPPPMLFGRKVLVPFTGQFLARDQERPQRSSLTRPRSTLFAEGSIMAFSISRPKADYLTIQKIADIDIALFAAPSLAVQVKSAEDLRRLPAVLTSNTEAAELTLDLTDGLSERNGKSESSDNGERSGSGRRVHQLWPRNRWASRFRRSGSGRRRQAYPCSARRDDW